MSFSFKKFVLIILPWTLTALFGITTFILLFLLFIFKNSSSVQYTLVPQEITDFSQLQCDYLLGSKLGWRLYNQNTHKLELVAAGFNSSTTTLATSSQHAKITRAGGEQLEVELFGFSKQIWNIQEESVDGLLAVDSKQGSVLSISKKSGLVIYSNTNYLGNPPAPSANQEASLFTCQKV